MPWPFLAAVALACVQPQAKPSVASPKPSPCLIKVTGGCDLPSLDWSKAYASLVGQTQRAVSAMPPYFANLRRTTGEKERFCSGVVGKTTSQHTVFLTAAHCLKFLPSGTDIEVVLGDLGSVVTVALELARDDARVHPKYACCDASYDVAFVDLSDSPQFSDAPPLDLWNSQPEVRLIGPAATAGKPQQLLGVLWSDPACAAFWNTLEPKRGTVGSGACYKSFGKADWSVLTYGDSGGPVLAGDLDSATVVGINSLSTLDPAPQSTAHAVITPLRQDIVDWIEACLANPGHCKVSKQACVTDARGSAICQD
jgi:hypothetical protein